MGVALAAKFRVEKWSDGSFSIPIDHAGQTWRCFFAFDEQWIRMSVPLTTRDSYLVPIELRDFLRWNTAGRLSRLGLCEGNVVLRVDCPIPDFVEADMRALLIDLEVSTRDLVDRWHIPGPPMEMD